jgi:hypothetical protein
MSATESEPTSKGRGYTIGAVICFILAALLTIPALVSYWGGRTINDTERYVATVGPLVNDPEVQAVISTKVTDTIEKQVDVEALLNQALGGVVQDRPKLQLLIGPLAGAINGFIAREVQQVVASPKFADLWVAVNTKAQEDLTALLRGEQVRSLSIQGDEVVLDLNGVIDEVKSRLAARGLTIVEKIPLPQTDKQIVLLTSPQLSQAKTIYAFANPVATWLIWVIAALYLGAFLLARRRPRMAVAIGIALAVNAIIVAWGLAVGQQLFVNELSNTAFGPASSVFWNTLLAFLERGWQVLLWLGIVLIVAGWFAGRTKSAIAVRGFFAGACASGGKALAGGPVAGAGRWVAGNARWLRWIAVALGFVVLFWGSETSLGRLAWAVGTVVVLLVVIEVLAAAGRGEGPADAVEGDDTSATQAGADVAEAVESAGG